MEDQNQMNGNEMVTPNPQNASVNPNNNNGAYNICCAYFC